MPDRILQTINCCLSNNSLYNETELLSLVAGGDENAFAILFRHYNDRIYSIAFKLTHSAILTEEIVQDVFLTVWLKRADLFQIENFQAYLYAITRNNAYKVLQRKAASFKTTIIPDDNSFLQHCDTENKILEKEYTSLLQLVIERLPAQQKKVYRLMKEEGMKRGEVAEMLKIHPETIKSHLAQAMRNIKNFCTLHFNTLLLLMSLFI